MYRYPFGYDYYGKLQPEEELELEAKDWACDKDIKCHSAWDDYKVFDRLGNDVSDLFALELRKAMYKCKLRMEM